MYKVAPLSSGFMVIGMLGFMSVVVYTSFGKISPTWGFTLGIVFVAMFVASMISMSYAPIEALIQHAPTIKSKKTRSKRP